MRLRIVTSLNKKEGIDVLCRLDDIQIEGVYPNIDHDDFRHSPTLANVTFGVQQPVCVHADRLRQRIEVPGQ